MRIVKATSQITPEIALTMGGKGSNLYKLTQSGAAVPPFLVITSPCFTEFIAGIQHEFDAVVDALDCSSPARVAETSRCVREFLVRQSLPAAIEQELLESLKDVAGPGDFLAVRSSALGEDSKEFSYAGMLDSYLFRKTPEEVKAAVLECWASLYSDRAVAYRHMRGVSQKGLAMAVVVQKMIDGSASGVTFTVNPNTKYVDEILISAVPGLGEGLVSGGLDADQFVVLKNEDYTIDTRTVVDKVGRVVFDRDKGFGTREEELPAESRNKPCLTDEQIVQIAKVCHQIERFYDGKPQDIEWTIDTDGTVRILQSRPITTIDRPFPSERAHITVWDNSNIVESYSGVTTPLTFSFALYAYHQVYIQFCEVLGVPKQDILEKDFNFGNMLGLLNGRIYYNLKNWYHLISVLPGYQYNSRFMEGMMGVKVKFDFDPTIRKSSGGFFQKYFIELPRLAWVGANLAWKFYTMDSQVKDFMTIFQSMYDHYKDFDFDNAPAQKLVEIYNELEFKVLRNWKAPIINDFMAMIFYGILRSLVSSWNLDKDGALANNLLAGQGNVESTLPLKALQKIAREIVSTPTLLETFKQHDPAALRRMFCKTPNTSDPAEQQKLCKDIQEYLNLYGYRSMNELKLEEPSLNEKPEFIFQMLKNYLSMPLGNEEDSGKKEAAMREEAEKRVTEMLAGQKIWGIIPKLSILTFVTKYAKKAMAVREYQRFARTKMYGLARRIFLGIGKRMQERGLLEDANDVFYLTKQEVIGYVVGTATSQKLRELSLIRKQEFDAYRAMDELPDRIETKGMVYTNDLTQGVLKAQESTDPNVLKGLAACPGIVRKRVKVILTPRDDMTLNGEILVAARTDPGWVPLYASASGLLIERGSMLSHSVIVARELGLPAIVGITDITKRVKTGDIVEMDGSTGIVRIIERLDADQKA